MNQLEEELDDVDNNVDARIIRERNEEVAYLLQEVEALHELMKDCATLLFSHGETLDIGAENVESVGVYVNESVQHLEQAHRLFRPSKRGEALCVLISTGIGALGWIGGPWIGVPATAAGAAVGMSAVLIKRKLMNNKT